MNSQGQKVILIAEDEGPLQRLWKRMFNTNGVYVLQAFTPEEAQKLFDENRNEIDIIIMDACLNKNHKPDTFELTRYIRAQFSGLIIATSGNHNHREEQMRCGCDSEADKVSVHERVREALGLS